MRDNNLSDEVQIRFLNQTSSKAVPINSTRFSKFRNMQSLPNPFSLNKKAKKTNIISEPNSFTCEIFSIDARKNQSKCLDSQGNKTEKGITSSPMKYYNSITYNPNQQQQQQHQQQLQTATPNRLSTSNKISYKERKLIRQLTTRTDATCKNSEENKYHETFNQTTQFKSFQTGYIATDSNEGYQTTVVPPMPTNLDLLTESNEESEVSERKIYERKRQKKITLLRLMKTNPYQSLKNNVFFNYRKNQLTYKQYSNKKPLLNAIKGKEEGTLLKYNKYSTISIKNKPTLPNIILRLLQRKNEMPSEFKNVIFWKGVHWLWNHYFGQIERLLVSFQYYKWFLEKEKVITFKKVEEFLLLIQLKKYKDFCDALFLIFEEGNNKGINLKFALTVLITTNKSSYNEQIKDTLEVWESGKTGRISCNDINEIMKNLYTNAKDIKTILISIKNAFDIQDWSKETVDKNDLLTLLLTDHKIPSLIKRNKVDIDKIEQVFKEEILNLFSINMRNSKMSLETHDAQKFCGNDINKYEKVLAILYNHNSQKQKRREEKQERIMELRI